ncbi:MAG: hypothetical protein E7397_03580 [Ruminococcaceae bacterium]|nr:hypothetical protein [Oscillospiraceae bacterium]
MRAVAARRKILLSSVQTELFLKLLLLFLLGRSSVLGVYPFGLPFLSAMLPVRHLYIGAVSMIAGCVSAGGGFLKYTMITVIYLIYTYFRKSRLLDAAFCAFSSLVSGIFFVVVEGQSLMMLGIVVAESVFSFLLYFVYRKLSISEWQSGTKLSREQVIAMILTAGIILTGFSGITLPGNIRPGLCLGIFLILMLGEWADLPVVGCFGMAMGFLSNMNQPEALLSMAICGMGAVFACLLREFGKIGVAGGFLLSSVVSWLYAGNALKVPVHFFEMCFAFCLYFAVPKRVTSLCHVFLEKNLSIPQPEKELCIKQHLSEELKHISDALHDLGESVRTIAARRIKTASVAELFDTVTERVCSSCPKWQFCWQQEYDETVRRMYSLLNRMEEAGYCDEYNLPSAFRGYCIRPDSIVSEFNHVYEMMKQSVLWRERAEARQEVVARQYSEISRLIENLSEEVECGFTFLQIAEARLDSALEKVGYFAKEISIIETVHHDPEVYIIPAGELEVPLLEKVVSEVLGTPMHLESAEQCWKLVRNNRFEIRTAIRQSSGNGEEECGDTVLQFGISDKHACVLLCDGMGSGLQAEEESRMTARLLCEFMRAGFVKETAVNLLNSTLAMRTGRESFSTVDLLEIDLQTGMAEFLKVGGAESYIIRKGLVEIVTASELPVGILDEVHGSVLKKQLVEGDVVVMISDGISEAGQEKKETAWLRHMLRECREKGDALAQCILEEASARSGGQITDDMSVVVMQIKRTGSK